MEKLKYKKVGRRLKVMQPRIKIKSELPFGKYTIPDQSKWSFTVVIDLYSLSFINEEYVGEGGGGAMRVALLSRKGHPERKEKEREMLTPDDKVTI